MTDFLKKLDLAADDVRAAAAKGLRDSAEDLLSRAQEEVPRDEGTLAGSGTVVPARGVNESRGELSVTVGFNTVYAARQHEDTGLHHPKGGKAKYLEDPMKANATKYGEHIAETVRKAGKA